MSTWLGPGAGLGLAQSAPQFTNPSRTGAGSVDPDFDPGPGLDQGVSTLALQRDGKLLVGGPFTRFGKEVVHGLIRLDVAGHVDSTFRGSTALPPGAVLSLLVTPDDHILVAGQLYGQPDTAPLLRRLNADGSPDPNFAGERDLIGKARELMTVGLQPDGKILVGGPTSALRLFPDGTLDASFHPKLIWEMDVVNRVPGGVSRFHVLPGGRFFAFGVFDSVDGAPHQGAARFFADGTLDSSFGSFPAIFRVQPASPVVVEVDEKPITLGWDPVTGANGIGIKRLRHDGNLDPTFDPGSGPNGSVTALELDPAGRLLVAGIFTAVNDSPRTNLARLNPDGTLDTSFDAGRGLTGRPASASYRINAMVVQGDGDVLVGGVFTVMDGIPRQHLARLRGAPALTASQPQRQGKHFTVRCQTVAGKHYELQYKDSLSDPSWNALPAVSGDGSFRELIDPGLPASQRFYRIQVQ